MAETGLSSSGPGRHGWCLFLGCTFCGRSQVKPSDCNNCEAVHHTFILQASPGFSFSDNPAWLSLLGPSLPVLVPLAQAGSYCRMSGTFSVPRRVRRQSAPSLHPRELSSSFHSAGSCSPNGQLGMQSSDVCPQLSRSQPQEWHFKNIYIYLFGCSRSLLWLVRSLVAVCELLAAACGI